MKIIEVSDCIWPPWGEWSPCKNQCGECNQTRIRKLPDPENEVNWCVGSDIELRSFNQPPCGKKKNLN